MIDFTLYMFSTIQQESKTLFHVCGLKCMECGSFNTARAAEHEHEHDNTNDNAPPSSTTTEGAASLPPSRPTRGASNPPADPEGGATSNTASKNRDQ